MTEQAGGRPSPVQFTGCRPVLPVKDVEASIAHYRDVLGFTDEWRWSNEQADNDHQSATIFAYVCRGSFELFLTRRPAPIQPVEIVVGAEIPDDIDRIFQEYQSSGATIEDRPNAKPWGTYEMSVRDPDPHLLRILTNLRGEG